MSDKPNFHLTWNNPHLHRVLQFDDGSYTFIGGSVPVGAGRTPQERANREAYNAWVDAGREGDSPRFTWEDDS
jgi:hypothetical protein